MIEHLEMFVKGKKYLWAVKLSTCKNQLLFVKIINNVIKKLLGGENAQLGRFN